MMTGDRIEELLVKFTAEISSLNSNMRSVLERLTNHESRITAIEQNKTGLKEDFLKMLVKTMTISTVGLIILGGGGTALAKLLSIF